MYPLSDNDMDRLSREASEQFDVEQPTSGWDRLEKKLDKELPREKDRRRFLWFFLLFLLLGGGTLSLILINDQQDKTLSQAATAQPATSNSKAPAETTAAAPATTGIENNAGTATASTNLPPASGTAHQQPETVQAQTQKESTAANTISSTKRKSIVQTPFRSGNEALAVSLNTKRKSNKRKTSNGNIPATEQFITDHTTKETKEVASTKAVEAIAPPATDNTVPPAIAAVPEKAPLATDTATQKPAAAETAATEKAAEAGKKKHPQIPVSKWSIGTTVGADWSRIHGTGDKRMGYNVGILVSYNITDRLSVSTGAIVTRKMYSALGKDFNPPQHYWTSYVKLESLDGYCQMIDIPLNIRYDLSVKGKNRWYASTGLSSYLMTNQYYNYYYYNNANQYTEKNWTNSANSEYWMGILNLSAGYERILNRKWSLQAEPFLKIPLKGVGFGNMDISSYGALFTLKYHPKF